MHKQMLTVGYRRTRCETSCAMPLLAWESLPQRSLPKHFPVSSIYRQGHELVAMRYGKIIVVARSGAWPWRQSVAVRNGGGEKYAIAPNHWGRVAATGNRCLPSDVRSVALAPYQRGVGLRRDACT